MKRIIYFIGLKIAEIVGVFTIYWLLCIIYSKTFMSFMFIVLVNTPPFWACAPLGLMMTFILLSVVFFIFYCAFSIIKKNWEWSKKLSQK